MAILSQLKSLHPTYSGPSPVATQLFQWHLVTMTHPNRNFFRADALRQVGCFWDPGGSSWESSNVGIFFGGDHKSGLGVGVVTL